MKKIDFPITTIFPLIFFVILLAVNLSFHRIGDYGAETNFFGLYVPQAQSLLHGHMLVGDYHGPVYPILLALAYLLIKNFLSAGIFLATASAALTVFLALKLIRQVFDSKKAFGAVALLALNPVFIQYSYSAGSDMFFVLLVTLSLYFLLKSKSFSWTNLILASVAAALAYLTRYNGIAIVAAAFIIFIIINHWQLQLKKRILVSFIFVSLFLICISPWGVYCLRQKGNFFFNQNYKTAACELYAKGRVTYEQFWFDNQTLNIDSFADVLTYDPILLGKRLVFNLARNFVKHMKSLVGWPFAAFVIIGFIYSIFSRPTKAQWSLYVYSFLFYCVLLFVIYDPRYSIFLVICYSILIMNGIQFVGKVLRNRQAETWLASVLVVLTALVSFGFNKKNISSGPVEVKKAAAWYQQNIPPEERGKILLARKPHLAYYTNMESRVIPLATSVDDLQNKVQLLQGDYLFISPIEIYYRENLKVLLEPKNAPSSFIPVYRDANPPAVLYRIKRTPQ
ncbi:MAG: glycosyltransferase family 39 protein [Acidobacteria bacterium]|nr:glycosyltransferase family 39 protein [Acidobacteriota bacterium]MBU4308149.1 glycosyltransferase family 39 protein [Acidobacteriota bacterium]MBU4405687.1 glycosyltransferase family 39 protein [Acidobacteriota bacterium]MCG2811170.1 glycosyltransferase family 39 protein [Candidatus Aminicenantes bacterium]